MKMLLLLVSAALASSAPVPQAELNLKYLPPSRPFQPPPDSYLPPPPPPDSYLPPSFARRSGTVAENVVDTGEPVEAAVEEYAAVDASVEVEGAEEAAAETPAEEEAPVEEEVVEDAALPAEESAAEEVEGQVEGGDQVPKFTPFYDDGEGGTLNVEQLHGVEGSYEVREEGEGYRNTDTREESKLYQNVKDVKTFNSEVHEYEYYPYESYGKEVTVLEPIIGKTYGFHAVPYQTSRPGYGPLRSVVYAPVQYPAYKHGPVYRPPPGYTREPSLSFPDDGTRYIARPPRPAAAGGDGTEHPAVAEENGEHGETTGPAYQPWPTYSGHQGVFQPSPVFPSVPVFAGDYSGGWGYGGGQGAESAEGEADASASDPESVSTGSESSAGSEDSAEEAAEGGVYGDESSDVQSSNNGDITADAEASASPDSGSVEASASSAVAQRRSAPGGQVPYHGVFPATPGWWSPAYPHPADVYQPTYADPFARYTPRTAASYETSVPAASTTHEVSVAAPADLARRHSLGGTPGQHSAALTNPSVVPEVDHDLVYAGGSVVPVTAYGDGVGGRYVREGNIPGYYVRCVRHGSGPPSVSLVPFAK